MHLWGLLTANWCHSCFRLQLMKATHCLKRTAEAFCFNGKYSYSFGDVSGRSYWKFYEQEKNWCCLKEKLTELMQHLKYSLIRKIVAFLKHFRLSLTTKLMFVTFCKNWWDSNWCFAPTLRPMHTKQPLVGVKRRFHLIRIFSQCTPSPKRYIICES